MRYRGRTVQADVRLIAMEMCRICGSLKSVASAGRKAKGWNGEGVVVKPDSLSSLGDALYRMAFDLVHLTGDTELVLEEGDVQPDQEEGT